MKKIKLSRKELIIIDLLIFVLVIKFAYEPIIKNVSDKMQMYLDRALLFIWFIIGIMLLTFCFTNLFSAIQILIQKKKINKESQEYIYKTQEYYIKFNNAIYFAKIFLFIYLLFNSLFIMGIIAMIYNFIFCISDNNKLKRIKSDEKEYNEIIYKVNNELQNITLYSIIINISYFYLRYNSALFQFSQSTNTEIIKFLIGILFLIAEIIFYFSVVRKIILSSNILVKFSSKIKVVISYVIINFILLNLIIYLLSHFI